MSGHDALPPSDKRFKHPMGPAVHRLLRDDWDPIGVSSFAPDDEYDCYVWPVISKLMAGASAEEVADYLDWASNEHIGMPQPRDRNLAIAEKLVALRLSND